VTGAKEALGKIVPYSQMGLACYLRWALVRQSQERRIMTPLAKNGRLITGKGGRNNSKGGGKKANTTATLALNLKLSLGIGGKCIFFLQKRGTSSLRQVEKEANQYGEEKLQGVLINWRGKNLKKKKGNR